MLRQPPARWAVARLRGVRAGRRPGGPERQRGSVTAETAVVLPSLVLVLAALLWAAAAAVAQLQCVDAARAGARALARGEAVGAARAAAAQAAPPGAAVQIGPGGGQSVGVEVHAEIKPLSGLFAAAPAVTVRSRATAPLEGALDRPQDGSR